MTHNITIEDCQGTDLISYVVTVSDIYGQNILRLTSETNLKYPPWSQISTNRTLSWA